MLGIKTTVKEMKFNFDMFITTVEMTEEIISDLEDM